MNKQKYKWIGVAARVFASVLLATLVCVLCSCHTKYIPVTSVRTDSVYSSTFLYDSIYIQDSIYIKEKGDTVFVDKFKYIYKYINIQDTCFIEKTDSILIPYPIERKLTWWERKTKNLGDWIVELIIIFILYRLLGWLIKKTRKE